MKWLLISMLVIAFVLISGNIYLDWTNPSQERTFWQRNMGEIGVVICLVVGILAMLYGSSLKKLKKND